MKKSKFDVEFQYLPEDIILKILTLLPAMSVGRCRCVSKKWRNLLSDPTFIKSHLNLSLNNRPHKALVFSHESSSFFVVDFHGGTTDHGEPVVSAAQLIKFDIPKFDKPNGWYLVYRCSDHQNGLILVGTGLFDGSNEGLFLLNPTTRECKEFPKPPGYLAKTVFGIGNNKAVAVNCYDRSVYVYTFKSNTAAATTWKRLQIQNSPLDHVVFEYNTNGIIFNGSIYWLGLTRGDRHLDPPVIIAFDLTEETIRAVPVGIPRRSATQNRVCTTLGVVGESLCIICQEARRESNKLDVWVMNHDQHGPKEEEKEKDSWTKLSFHKTYGVHGVSFLGNEEFILISKYLAKAVIYNIKEKSSRGRVVFKGAFNSARVDYGSAFVDSLVSPRQLLL